MLKLVIITAICLGLPNIKAFSPEDAIKEQEVLKEEASSPFNNKAGLPTKTQFYCHKRPSGYYADPRFNCEVFHFCHGDGTRVTIPCGGQDNHKHKICLLKDIATKACDGTTELYLALPQDLFFKASKDTTASALNGATNYKVPEVLPEPSEDRVSTTPLSPQGYRYVAEDTKDEGIYEVFNSFLKEIEGGRNLEARSGLKPRTIENSNSKPRPATFSRGSRILSSLERTDALIDAPLAGIGKRIDGDGALLVEIYNDDDNSDNNDYSSYSRKAKKLFPTSDKKTPAKHPRRRKRTVREQQFHQGRPYAIIYAKVPDTTLPGSISGFGSIPSETQERRGVFTSGEVPMVPVTIETRRKKKRKSKKKSLSSKQQPQTNQQTSEQQNIYFYTPDQVNSPLDGRTRTDPRPRVTETRAQSPRQQLNEAPQQGQQPSFSGPSPYPNLQIPSFPFQAQQFVNAPRQPSYFFTPQDGYSPFASPFGAQQQQFQQPQSRPQTQPQSRPQTQPQSRPQTQPQSRPQTQPQRPSGAQEGSAPPHETTGTTAVRPSSLAQGYQRFQNPFFDSFSGFGGGAPFGGPYTQREPSSYSLLPPGQIHQQVPPLLNTQLSPQPYVDTGRPQSQPQSQLSPENRRPEISVAVQPNQDPRLYSQGVPQQDRTRPSSEDSQPSPISSQQRPPRNRGRPASNVETSNPQSSGRVRENPQFQRPRQPSTDSVTADRNRQRPQQYIQNIPPIVYQPEYAPQDLILQPENPFNPPIRNGYPQEQPQAPPRPVILLEDLTQQDRRPQNPEGNPREVVYSQIQPISERPQRRPEQSRRPKPPQQQDDVRPQQPSRYLSPTPSPPSSRTRQQQATRHEKQRERTRPVEESAVPNDVDANPDYGHRTAPPPDERPSNVRTRPENNRVANRYNPIALSPPIPQRRPSSEVRRPPSEVSGDHRQQSARPTRYQSNPRNRPREGTQPQIERPPSEYVPVDPQPEIYSGPPGYYTYPPHGNDVNIVSTANELEDRPHTPPSTRHQNSHRQPTSNVRNSANGGDPELQLGFIPMTEKPYQESYYRTLPTTRGHTEAVEEYSAQDKTQNNRYQDLNEEHLTTRQVSTTRRPRSTTQKPRPPPPKPTFPTFPSFPPPPRRPITSPKPKTDTPEIKIENSGISDYVSSDPDQLAEAVLRSTSQLDALVGTERLRNSKEFTGEDSVRTDAPEVTTRRRTRKKKQRPRKPRPTTSYLEDGHTTIDILTQPTTEKEVIPRTTSSRQNRWQKQTTAQPRRASVSPSEEATTETSGTAEEFGSRINLFAKQRSRNPTLLKPRVPATIQSSPSTRGESSRVTKTPTVTRSRKPLNSRVRTRTTTEFPETLGPIARSDENSEFLYYQSEDFTTESSTSLPEYEPMTMIPMESTTESTYTTESYNEVIKPTPEDATFQPDDETDIPQDESQKMGDFESTRSVAKKFQNRPRILKFGKPKLRTTILPINLNVAESRIY